MNPDNHLPAGDPNQAPQPVAPPQPQPQPMAAPFQSQPTPQSAPGSVLPPQPSFGQPYPPASGMNKGVLIAIIAGVVGIIAIALILVLGVFNKPKTSDYSSAKSKLSEVISDYNKVTDLSYVSTYNITETVIKNNLDKIKTSREGVSTKFNELGKMKAVNQDGDVKAAYNKVKEKISNYDTAMSLLQEIYEQVLPAATELSGIDKYSRASAAEATTALKNIRQKFESAKVSHEANKTMVDGMVAQLKALESVNAKLNEVGDDYKNYDIRSKLRNEAYDISDKVDNLIIDWKSNTEKAMDAGNIGKELGTLDDIIFEKSIKLKE